MVLTPSIESGRSIAPFSPSSVCRKTSQASLSFGLSEGYTCKRSRCATVTYAYAGSRGSKILIKASNYVIINYVDVATAVPSVYSNTPLKRKWVYGSAKDKKMKPTESSKPQLKLCTMSAWVNDGGYSSDYPIWSYKSPLSVQRVRLSSIAPTPGCARVSALWNTSASSLRPISPIRLIWIRCDHTSMTW